MFEPDGLARETLARFRALLAERFRLKAREEDRVRPVYRLRRATSDSTLGPKIRRTDVDCGALMRGQRPAGISGQNPPCSLKTPPGRLFASTFPMAAIASLLSTHLDRPVLDRTGLEGRFDIELEAAEIKAPSNYQPGPSDLALGPANGPSMFVAVRQQLGLQLEPATAAVTVIVIEDATRP